MAERQGLDIEEELEPDYLIRRCEECDFCIFEEILLPEQRKKSVLEQPIPNGAHLHRSTIEGLCAQDVDSPCDMKYAVMRAGLTPYIAVQFGCMNTLKWDLGKRTPEELNKNFGHEVDPEHIENDDGCVFWAVKNDKGRGLLESYAERFRNVWNSGLRPNGTVGVKKQILSENDLYEWVVAGPETYGIGLKILELRKLESERRAVDGIYR